MDRSVDFIFASKVYYGTMSLIEVHMKSLPVLAVLVGALVLAVFPGLGQAQNIGLRVGIAPPPVVAGQGTFTFVPTFVGPSPLLPIASVPLVPNFPTVFVPPSVLVPGQTFVLPPVVNPAPFVVNPSPFVVNPAPFVVNPAPFGVPTPVVPTPFPRGPRLGMPRADVLRLLGQPSVTIITSSGETLYFTGGVTVIIQNGQVVGPR
jgi:hypothetical protein